MKKFFSTLCAAAVVLGTAAAGTTAAGAAPLNIPRVVAQDTDVTNVQQRRGYYRQGGRHYYNGHRGHRERRAGYRQHNGWWFPPAAFALGAIIGSQQQYRPPVYRGPSSRAPAYRAPAYRGNAQARAAHVRWCQSQYRSYRASDNTFQPFNGPRRQCVSPYYG